MCNAHCQRKQGGQRHTGTTAVWHVLCACTCWRSEARSTPHSVVRAAAVATKRAWRWSQLGRQHPPKGARFRSNTPISCSQCWRVPSANIPILNRAGVNASNHHQLHKIAMSRIDMRNKSSAARNPRAKNGSQWQGIAIAESRGEDRGWDACTVAAEICPRKGVSWHGAFGVECAPAATVRKCRPSCRKTRASEP